jgi:hypothetical protein
MISRAQFQKLADVINTGGGFSHKVAGPQQGKKAADAYMVGMPGYGKDFEPDQPVSGADLEQFAQEEQSVLSQPEIYMGGWQGADPVRASVDISQRFDRSLTGSLVSARVAATTANQEAIGEVDKRGGYVGDIVNPYYRSDRPQSFREDPTLFESSWEQTGDVDPIAVDILAQGKPMEQKKSRRKS